MLSWESPWMKHKESLSTGTHWIDMSTHSWQDQIWHEEFLGSIVVLLICMTTIFQGSIILLVCTIEFSRLLINHKPWIWDLEPSGDPLIMVSLFDAVNWGIEMFVCISHTTLIYTPTWTLNHYYCNRLQQAFIEMKTRTSRLLPSSFVILKLRPYRWTTWTLLRSLTVILCRTVTMSL